MAEAIKKLFFAMNGAFLPKEGGYIDESLMGFKAQVLSDMEMSHSIEDRINMKRDVNNVRSDFRKSVGKYKEASIDG